MKATRLNLLLLISSCLTVFTNALKVTSKTVVNKGDTLYTDAVTIDENAYLAIITGYTHNFYSDLTVNGALYIGDYNKRHSGITVDVIGTKNVVTNNGIIVVDNRNATSAPTYDWSGAAFYNYGNLFFNGRGDTGGSTYWINPYSTFVNEGIIMYSQTVSRSGGSMHLGRDDSTITNDGTICLINALYFQGSTITGNNGCINIGQNSNMWVTNTNTRKLSGQTIYMSSTSSSLRIDAYPPGFTFKIRGFQNGNVIGSSTAISSFSYDETSGILTMSVGSYRYSLDIGTGYDSSKFYTANANYGYGVGTVFSGGLYYNGAVSDEMPNECKACPEIPWFTYGNSISSSSVFTIPPPYTTTETTDGSTFTEIFSYSSTNSDGKPATATTVYTLSTSTSGSTTSSTSVFTIPPPYTTTETTDGSTFTEIFSYSSTNSDGKPATATTIYTLSTSTESYFCSSRVSSSAFFRNTTTEESASTSTEPTTVFLTTTSSSNYPAASNTLESSVTNASRDMPYRTETTIMSINTKDGYSTVSSVATPSSSRRPLATSNIPTGNVGGSTESRVEEHMSNTLTSYSSQVVSSSTTSANDNEASAIQITSLKISTSNNVPSISGFYTTTDSTLNGGTLVSRFTASQETSSLSVLTGSTHSLVSIPTYEGVADRVNVGLLLIFPLVLL
ncbi:LAFE_0A00122g1_1 [Lachancea fermentati]|uniref:LAFE_0A00122g1_1 n=1 Tax=Lachancea fermentati TaxID=4955 RepID=A0A1G4M657_LACFM|nr:LAFE_0A00122g1_1 [Lachancea fermentati]